MRNRRKLSNKNRRNYIGASDLNHVFSLPPYGCARKLQYEKTGQPPDYPWAENSHIKRGKFYEPIALRLYQKETGNKLVRRAPTLVHPDYPFIVAHPDAIRKADGLPVEVKCPTKRNFEKIKYEGLQEAYILQIHLQIALAKVPAGVSVTFCPETTERTYFDVKADNDLIQMILARMKEFWEKAVQGNEEVRRLDPTDRRCQTCLWRKTCQGVALLQEDTEGNGQMEADYTLAPLVEEYQKAKEISAEAEEYLEDVKGRICQAMGNRVAVETAGSRIYYRPVESWRWDTKALGQTHPELEKDFKKKVITRPLRIYSV